MITYQMSNSAIYRGIQESRGLGVVDRGKKNKEKQKRENKKGELIKGG